MVFMKTRLQTAAAAAIHTQQPITSLTKTTCFWGNVLQTDETKVELSSTDKKTQTDTKTTSGLKSLSVGLWYGLRRAVKHRNTDEPKHCREEWSTSPPQGCAYLMVEAAALHS